MKAGKDINIERLLTSILFHHFVSWTKPLSLSGILHLLLTDSSFICISKDPLKRRETDIKEAIHYSLPLVNEVKKSKESRFAQRSHMPCEVQDIFNINAGIKSLIHDLWTLLLYCL